MYDMATIRRQIANPPLIAEKDQYLIKFAITDAEIEDAFKLRYNVFNVEQGKGQIAKSRGQHRENGQIVAPCRRLGHRFGSATAHAYRAGKHRNIENAVR